MPASIAYSEWKAAAKIDFITIEFPKAELKSIRDAVKLLWNGGGTIQCAKRFGLWNGHGCDWLTVHDPDREALQFLVDTFPRTQVLDLEIAVDLRPRDGSRSIAKLTQAHAWLMASLFPQKHKEMAGVSHRKRFDAADGKVKRIGLKTKAGRETVYWQNRTGFEQVRLYVKTKDKHITPVTPATRIEITLNRGGCHKAGVTRLESLPAFAPNVRRYVSPFFEIAKGIQPKVQRVRSSNPLKMSQAADNAKNEQNRVERNWKLYGASWAALHDYKAIPDREANRLIGGALNELRRDLMKLKLP